MAFRRRVTIVSGEYEAACDSEGKVPTAHRASLEIVAPESNEGRRLLVEAVGILQETLALDDSEIDE